MWRLPRTRWIAWLALAGVVSACSGPQRYRWLKFFFDGVPEPGATQGRGYAVEDHALARDPAGGPERAERSHAPLFSHPPYRENRCGACHNREDGQIFRTPEEGLCATCHSELRSAPAFLHGPVAVNACAFCHHHHVSRHAGLLLDEATALCLRCHETADLTSGPHHPDPQADSCTHCHDPHGADNRLFLRPDEP